MIPNFFLGLIADALKIFPVCGSFPSQISSASTYMHDAIWKLNWLLPVDTLIAVLLWIFGIEISYYSFVGLLFVLRMIRGN